MMRMSRAGAMKAASIIFWFYYVSGGVFLPLKSGDSIPEEMFGLWFMGGAVLIIVVYALAVLLLYKSDLSEKKTFIDGLKNMSRVRTMGLTAFLLIVMMVVLLWSYMSEVGRGDAPPIYGYFLTCNAAIIYLILRFIPVRMARFWDVSNQWEQQAVIRAKKLGDKTLGIAALSALLAIATVAVFKIGDENIGGALSAKIPMIVFQVVVCGILGVGCGGSLFLVGERQMPGRRL